MRSLVLLLTLFVTGCASTPSWQIQNSPAGERLRGVSAVSPEVAWASGAKGSVVRTTDGGNEWQMVTVPESSKLDFRDVEGFSASSATVLAIGTGTSSRIYRTTGGGASWIEEFINRDERAFYDCFAFWNADRGIVFSDPVEGRIPLMLRNGAGWRAAMGPDAQSGGFAASGTCVATRMPANAWIVTGAAVYHSADEGVTWTRSGTPVSASTESSGIFSIAVDGDDAIVVGGDYAKPDAAGVNAAWSSDGGSTWQVSERAPGAFRSAVAFTRHRGKKIAIAVGPTGSSISFDAGRTWSDFPGNFHALSLLPNGVGWAVGEKGTIARLAWRN